MNKVQRIKQELAYKGHIVDVYDDYLILPNGENVIYDLVKFKGGAAVLAIDEEGKVILVKQYRNSLDRDVLELPSGCYDFPGEDGEVCARREFAEETGCIAGKMEFLVEIVSAIGAGNEKTKIYFTKDYVLGQQKLDPNEFVEIIKMDINEIVDMIFDGKLIDAKTIAGIMAYKVKFNV